MTDDTIQFSQTDRDSIYKIIAARRDMRHFIKDRHVEPNVLLRLLTAAHQAPSVGLMQPWRFIHIQDGNLRESIARLVDTERKLTSEALDTRKEEFLRLKVEGIRDCAELFAVVQAPDDGTVLGRRTLPSEMALCSTACAIQNLWLAARAENLGLGWVSFFDPGTLAQLLHCPSDALPIALLCLGPVESFYTRPMLEQEHWRQGKPLTTMLFKNHWPDGHD